MKLRDLTKIIVNKINEHKEQNYCSDYEQAIQTLAKDVQEGADECYDAGRYECMVEIFNELMSKEKEVTDFVFEIRKYFTRFKVIGWLLDGDGVESDMYCLKIEKVSEINEVENQEVYHTWIDSDGGIIEGNETINLLKGTEHEDVIDFAVKKFLHLVEKEV